uniref:Uncharacterized protein n=1 Tax=Hyaloperonospora arabidopsidis (strain Emoy2) TaxID=559515 RepID=M4B747_HYAAE
MLDVTVHLHAALAVGCPGEVYIWLRMETACEILLASERVEVVPQIYAEDGSYVGRENESYHCTTSSERSAEKIVNVGPE